MRAILQGLLKNTSKVMLEKELKINPYGDSGFTPIEKVLLIAIITTLERVLFLKVSRLVTAR